MDRMTNLRDDSTDYSMLLPAVYAELRKIASSTMARLPGGSTLQPTALVHEAWLRLGGKELREWQNRAHFFAAAAEAMRHILIDRARQRCTARHGGGLQRVDIDQLEIPIDLGNDELLLEISAAVDRLAVENQDAADLVVYRVFGGLTLADAASILSIPRTTAARRWQFAIAWLYCDLNRSGAGFRTDTAASSRPINRTQRNRSSDRFSDSVPQRD